MAYAFRLDDVRMAYIRIDRAELDRAGFAAETLAFALRLGAVEHPLRRAVLKGDTVSIVNDLCEVERILQRSSNQQVALVIRNFPGCDLAGRELPGRGPVHVEPLFFHHSFFMPLVDYAKALPVSAPGAQPELLAAFTHAFDDNDMLRLWERHHAQLVGHQHLYVLDHGSAASPAQVLHPKTNVVRLPRGATDHADIARFCGNFQRFLLSQYRWVLHTDADELLVDAAGNAALLARLAGDAEGGIRAPGQAFDILQDLRTEGPLRPCEPLGPQRGFMLPNPLYKKPLLASEPASWLQGFHQVYEEQRVREDTGLWLLHLQSADFGLLLQKNQKWNAIRQSEADRRISPQNRPADTASLKAWFQATLADPALLPIPEALRALF